MSEAAPRPSGRPKIRHAARFETVSDERFFAQRGGPPVPLSEIDLNAVREKAVTNAHHRAVRAIVGLGGLSWEEVCGAGLESGRVATVSYGIRKGVKPVPAMGSMVVRRLY